MPPQVICGKKNFDACRIKARPVGEQQAAGWRWRHGARLVKSRLIKRDTFPTAGVDLPLAALTHENEFGKWPRIYFRSKFAALVGLKL